MDSADSILLPKITSLTTKAKNFCKDIFKNSRLPLKITDLDNFVTRIIDSTNYLKALEVRVVHYFSSSHLHITITINCNNWFVGIAESYQRKTKISSQRIPPAKEEGFVGSIPYSDTHRFII